MKLLSNLVRNGLGYILVFFDRITRPTPIDRDPKDQEDLESELDDLSIYQFMGCPFCVKVRRAVHRLNLPIEYRDAQKNPEHREALKKGGGKVQVPCLRIDREGGTEWLYESDEIIAFLEGKFQ